MIIPAFVKNTINLAICQVLTCCSDVCYPPQLYLCSCFCYSAWVHSSRCPSVVRTVVLSVFIGFLSPNGRLQVLSFCTVSYQINLPVSAAHYFWSLLLTTCASCRLGIFTFFLESILSFRISCFWPTVLVFSGCIQSYPPPPPWDSGWSCICHA